MTGLGRTPQTRSSTSLLKLALSLPPSVASSVWPLVVPPRSYPTSRGYLAVCDRAPSSFPRHSTDAHLSQREGVTHRGGRLRPYSLALVLAGARTGHRFPLWVPLPRLGLYLSPTAFPYGNPSLFFKKDSEEA